MPSPPVKNAYYVPFANPDFKYRYSYVQVTDSSSGVVVDASPLLVVNPGGAVDGYIPRYYSTVFTSTRNEFSFGQAPPHWFGSFSNSETQVVVQPALTNYAAFFLRQSWDREEHGPLPYDLYRQGSPVQSGTLPAKDGLWEAGDPVAIPLAASGAYSLIVTYDGYLIGNHQGQASVLADFDTTRADKNPPTLLSLNILAGGETADRLDAGAAAEVRFRLTDDGGLSGVALSYRAGGGWIAVPLTSGGDEYIGQLPGFTAGTYVDLKIVAPDTAGNSLSYEVAPAFRVGPPLPFLLAPTNGQAVPVGNVAFSWTSVTGATGYRIQIDTVPTFDSGSGIDEIVAGTSTSHNFLLPGTRYWRARALPGDEWTTAWTFRIRYDVAQVSTGTSDDHDPALVTTAGGELVSVWESNSELWTARSTDEGATWSVAAQLAACCRVQPALLRAADDRLWLVYSQNGDLWYRTSSDGGLSWSVETRLTALSGSENNPDLAQTTDGRIWVVWEGSGASNLSYKTSGDNGVSWGADTAFPVETGWNGNPSIAQASNGTLWLVWFRGYGLAYSTSVDGGSTWSPLAYFEDAEPIHATAIRRATDGALWLAYSRGRLEANRWRDHLYYRTSTDNGATWSGQQQYTAYVGDHNSPMITPLGGGRMGMVWHADRSGNFDIWFGIPGEREDLNPPPYISALENRPSPNPDSDDTITFRAWAQDETGVAGVALVWTLNGAAQTDLTMYDDGAHGDDAAGDGIYGAQQAPLPAGSQVTYRARATDARGNTYLYPSQKSFTVLAPLVKTADILFVPDYGGNNTSSFRSYYTSALDTLGYTYDTWDTGLRGFVPASVLAQYTTGRVICSVPDWGYVTNDSNQRAAVQSYLDAGGKLFITGQNLAQNLSGNSFLSGYLHASFVQADSGLSDVAGISGDPVGDGLAFGLTGGGGANNQNSKDEIAAIEPASSAFAYQPAASSKTAGLRVSTGTYKVVYFAFGFEGINSATDRAEVMERVLAWLNGMLPRPILQTPANGESVPAGDVAFSWTSVTGATGYQIQIDTMPTFDSAGLIDQTVAATNYTHNFTTLGTHYWRVRALPGGEWIAARRFSVSGDVVRVTDDLSGSPNSPAIVQMADGKLWAVWSSRRSGNSDLWYRTSFDSGVTWASEVQLTTDPNSDGLPSIAQAVDGRIWVVWNSNRTGNYDVWYKASGDGGITWTPDTQLTTDTGMDWFPAVVQLSDGKIWVVWDSNRSGNRDIWYKTSGDGGLTWSSDTQLTTDPGTDAAPRIARSSDGKVWVVWTSSRGNRIWYKSSTDNGATWTSDTEVPTTGALNQMAAVAQGSDGRLWVTWQSCPSGLDDIWYKTSSDGGVTWSDDARLTRFAGYDERPAITALSASKVGIVWQSNRRGTYDIWFGIPGELEDVNPPPYVQTISHSPRPNPDSDDTITFNATALDETGLASVILVWTLGGAAQTDLPMYDDGAHGDGAAGDYVYGAQLGPWPAGSQVAYRARATDIDGNTYLYPGQNTFTVLAPFAKTAGVLFVPDNYGGDTSGTRSFYISALDSLSYPYDLWDTGQRGVVSGSVLNQYTGGVVIWSMPGYLGYITQDGTQRTAVQDYLAAGGKLFISGQNIAARLNGNAFLTDYLHASYVQDDTGLYALVGTASDPIGDGLALSISGSGGANNQSSKDEVNPISPALTILSYQAGMSQALVPSVRPVEPPTNDTNAPGYPASPDWLDALAWYEQLTAPAGDNNTTPQGIIGSGTAGLRVETGTYKVVYFAFGFEAINSAANRAEVMNRVLSWLGACATPGIPQNLTIQRNGTAVDLSWSAVAADFYEVWRATGNPYFAPAGACVAPACAITTGTSHTDSGVLNDPDHNYFYTVRGARSCGLYSSPSSRVGEFEFRLTPGGP